MKENKLTATHIKVVIVLCLSIAAGIGLVTNIGGLFISQIAGELATGRGGVSNTMSICNFIFAIGGMFLPRILNTRNFKKVLLCATLLVVISTYGLSFSNYLWQLYVLNAVRGFCGGLCTSVLSNIIINNWFYANTGLISSVALGFSGIAGAIFSPVFGKLIVNYGWRYSYKIAAVLMLVLFLPILITKINLTPEAVNEKPYGEKPQPIRLKKDNAKEVPVSVFVLLVLNACLCGLSSTLIQHFPGLAEASGLTVGSLMLSCSMVSNTAGKILMGGLIDRFGVDVSIIGITLFSGFGFLLLFYSNSFIYALAAFIIGFAYSLSTVGNSMLTRKMVGVERYAIIYPTIAMFSTVSYALGTSAVGYAYDYFGSYRPLLFFYLILFVMIILISLICKKIADNT